MPARSSGVLRPLRLQSQRPHDLAVPDRHLFTSESVTEGHPDKVADAISDAVLDAILAEDPDRARRVRDAGHDRPRLVAGEITTTTYVDLPDVVRDTIERIGYTDARIGFDARRAR